MKNKGIFDSVFLAMLLSVVGGFLDAYSYTARGNVLATAQTGNMIFLCVGLSQQDYARAVACLFPIIAFSLGVLTSLFCKKHFSESEAMLAFVVLALQGVGLCIIPFIQANSIANALISYACGAQVAVFRTIKGNPYATTMSTGNLRSAIENSFKYAHTKSEKHKNATLIYILILASFLIGAYTGTVLTSMVGIYSAFVAAIAIFICAIISLSKSRKHT